MGSRRIIAASLLVHLTLSAVLSKHGDVTRVHSTRKRSLEHVKPVQMPEGIQHHQLALDQPIQDSRPLYLMANPPPPPLSSFPVVAKVVQEDQAMEGVKDVADRALLTLHSYKGPQAFAQQEPAGYGAKKGKAVQQQQQGEDEECPYCPSGNCPYCRGKGGNGAVANREEEEEEQTEQCPNCPSGKCPWCHGKNQQAPAQNQGRCPNCPSGKCPWCHGKNRQTAPQQQEEEEEYEDEEQGQPQQQCPNCPSGKCPWCHGKNQQVAKPAANSFSDHSKRGGQLTQNEEQDEEQGQCRDCPSGRCPWCGGALTKNGKCAGCPDGRCPWCQRNLETGEGPDGSPPPNQKCLNCPSGKCPWCHGKNQQQPAAAYSAYNNNQAPASRNNQVEQPEEEEEEEQGQQQQCANCPSGRCPWCGGALTKNGKCAGCPDGKCPWCHRSLETGEGPDGSPAPNQKCPNCPSGKCPWCHGKNQQQAAEAANGQHQGYNNGQKGGCPYCPSGKCPWCHGKGQPPTQQPEVEYEYEEEPEEEQKPAAPKRNQNQAPPPQQQQQQQWNQNQAPAPPAQSQTQHYGPPPGYQPQSPQSYANVQNPPTPAGKPASSYPNQQQQPQTQPEYEYEEEEEEPQQQQQQQQQRPAAAAAGTGAGQFGVRYGAIEPQLPPAAAASAVANYQAPGAAPAAPGPAKFRTGITSAVAPAGSMQQQLQHVQYPSQQLQGPIPPGVSQSTSANGCCVISLPAGRYQILPAAAKSRRKRSIENFRNRFLLRD